VHKTAMFGIATPWRRIKHCPKSKKMGEKGRKRDVRSHKTQGCPISDMAGGSIGLKPMIFGLSTLQIPGNPCPISKKSGKKRKKCDVRSRKTKDVRSRIERKNGPNTEMCGCQTPWRLRRGKPCPISKKVGGKKEEDFTTGVSNE